MLEVLLAIKNNNMVKIPNYDPTHSEHLKKLMKGCLRKGNYVTELRISLDDLLNGNFISISFNCFILFGVTYRNYKLIMLQFSNLFLSTISTSANYQYVKLLNITLPDF